MLDLYMGYNKQLIDPSPYDLTMFQTPYSTLHLVTLPMRWTNLVSIFYNDVTFILQSEFLHNILSFIDNISAKGLKNWKLINSMSAKHLKNLNICLTL